MGSKFKSNKYNFNDFRAVSSPPQMHIAHFVSLPSFFNFFLPKMIDQISKRTHMLRIKEATYAKIRYILSLQIGGKRNREIHLFLYFTKFLSISAITNY